MLWMMTGALAATPAVEVTDGHRVVGVAELAAPPEAVRALLADPEAASRATGGETEVRVLSRDEGCVVTERVTPHPIATVRSEVRQCATADGFAESLVRSNQLAALDASWALAAVGEATRVTYTLHVQPSLSVPRFLVDRQSRKSVEAMLASLQRHFGGR